MLASLKNLFTPAAVAQSLKTLQPLESTIMDRYFKSKIAHPLPVIGISDIKGVTQTIPLVRRDGTSVVLNEETMETQPYAPKPVKATMGLDMSEINDLRLILGNSAAAATWRTRKLDQMRRVIHGTTEGMCAKVLTTGKLSWPVQLEGGRMEQESLDFGEMLTHTIATKLTGTTKLSEVYRLLRDMQKKIRMAGLGGKVEFLCGADVASVFLDMAENYRSTAQDAPIGIKLGDGEVRIGNYIIRFMDETYPDPTSGQWVDKLDPKKLLCVAVDVPGTIFYCAIDSVSANNAAVPLHITVQQRLDDSGFVLYAQSKPLPARPSRGSCLCVAVD